MKIDENINFKILKLQIGTTFGTMTKFKDVIAMLTCFEGYDLRIGVSNSIKKRTSVVCKESCSFKIYA